MKLWILFWFYKDIDICKNRLLLLRKYNPNSNIFWLFWWNDDEAEYFKNELEFWLNDFYQIKEIGSFRKRIHGDLMILERFNNRWIHLHRDSIIISQRDMIAFDSFEHIFADIEKDQLYLPQYGFVDSKFEDKRRRTSKRLYESMDDLGKTKSYTYPNYIEFKKYVNHAYWYDKLIPYCIFMTAVLSRSFLLKYSQLPNIELWFLEYKIPTYAKILWFDIYDKLYLWEKEDNPETWNTPMNALQIEVNKDFIDFELQKSSWWRVFHPYFHIYDFSKLKN